MGARDEFVLGLPSSGADELVGRRNWKKGE